MTEAPTFTVQAMKDPMGANLDRIQIIKGWVDAAGEPQEKIIDVVWSGDRAPGADGKLPPVGNTVDVATARYTNDIGAPELIGHWTDPSSIRPSPRFTTCASSRSPPRAGRPMTRCATACRSWKACPPRFRNAPGPRPSGTRHDERTESHGWHRNSLLGAGSAAAVIALSATQALAVEGGIGAYFMGTRDTFAGIVPPPGTYLSFTYDNLEGEVDGLSVGGIPIRADTDLELNLLRIGHHPVVRGRALGRHAGLQPDHPDRRHLAAPTPP